MTELPRVLLPGKLVSMPCVEPLIVPALLPVTEPAAMPTEAAFAPIASVVLVPVMLPPRSLVIATLPLLPVMMPVLDPEITPVP